MERKGTIPPELHEVAVDLSADQLFTEEMIGIEVVILDRPFLEGFDPSDVRFVLQQSPLRVVLCLTDRPPKRLAEWLRSFSDIRSPHELGPHVRSLLTCPDGRPQLFPEEWFPPPIPAFDDDEERILSALNGLTNPKVKHWAKHLDTSDHSLRRFCKKRFGQKPSMLIRFFICAVVRRMALFGATIEHRARLLGRPARSLMNTFARHGEQIPRRWEPPRRRRPPIP